MMLWSNESGLLDVLWSHERDIKRKEESRVDPSSQQHDGERRSNRLDPKCSRIAALFSQLREEVVSAHRSGRSLYTDVKQTEDQVSGRR